jgi:hypothetical protein
MSRSLCSIIIVGHGMAAMHLGSQAAERLGFEFL